VWIRPAALIGAVALSAPRVASAATFDEAGELSFEPNALYTDSFEGDADAGADASPDVADTGDGDADAGEDEAALHGQHVLHLEQFQSENREIPLPASTIAVGARIWARGEVVALLEAEVNTRSEEYAVFYPTGRMTSDGWYELAAHALTVDASRVDKLNLGLFSPTGADVDAFELLEEGSPLVGAPCKGATEKLACAPSQICMWGRCRNFESRVPPLPPPAWRDDLVDYLDQRFELLFGPYENRKLDLPNARIEIDAMRSATDAWSFWRHFRVAIHRLHDWHTRGSDVSGFISENPRPIAVCFIEGKADLSDQSVASKPGYLDVLVSHVGTVNTFGLHAGDRLVSVDGQHPLVWARSLITQDFDYETASNHVTDAEATARLNRLISAFADHIEVLRCDPATNVCATKTETISISDLADSPPGTPTGIGCDNRPILHLPGAPAHHSLGGFYTGIVKESDETEAIYGLQWSSLAVTSTSSGLGASLTKEVDTWRANARGVILDHRTGFGGTTLGPAIIWALLRHPTPLDLFQFRQRVGEQPPATLAEGKALFDSFASKGAVEFAGGGNPDESLPVALLIHLDGSASDWLPMGVKGSKKAKIFGPYQSAGAFSTLFTFGYWFGIGYSIAVGDTLHESGMMLNGHGVEPDVVVLPLQSDLLAGKDTVYDTALAWVRSELKP